MSASAAELPVSPATTLEPPPPHPVERDVADDTADIPHPSPSAVEPQGDAIELIIEPRKGWIGIDWQELFRNRELLYFLVWRDIKVRYKQAVLGVGWAVLQPVVQMVVFTLIFGIAARMRGSLPQGLPYSVFVLSGLIPWQLFVTSLGGGGMSLVNQQHLLTKIYFPRLFIPTSVAGGALMDMGISSVLFVVLLAINGIAPTWGVLLLPPLLVLTLLVSLGMSYLLAALTVTYRDFRFLIPFMAQIWMWVSFVAFPPPHAVETWRWRWVLAFNPMYPIISAYRKILLGGVPGMEDWMIGWHWSYLWASIATSVAIFLLGLFYFRKTERRFSDIA